MNLKKMFGIASCMLLGSFAAFAQDAPPLPDLVVAEVRNVTQFQSPYEKRLPLDFEVVVRADNVPAGTSLENVRVTYYIGSTIDRQQSCGYAETVIPSLAGETTLQVHVSTADCRTLGNSYLRVEVDGRRAIAESDDFNNRRDSDSFNIVANHPDAQNLIPEHTPDLEIVSIERTPALQDVVEQGETPVYRATIRNRNYQPGDLILKAIRIGMSVRDPGNARIVIVGNTVYGCQTLAETCVAEIPLPAEMTRQLNIMRAGGYQVVFVLDDMEEIRETDENNNRFVPAQGLRVVAPGERANPPVDPEAEAARARLPDLVVTEIRNVSVNQFPDYRYGEILEFDVTVRNQNAAVPVVRDVGVTLNFTGMGFNQSVREVRGEAVVHFRINPEFLQVPVGRHDISAQVNSSHSIEESEPNNNLLITNLYLTLSRLPQISAHRPEEDWNHQPDLEVIAINNLTAGSAPYPIGTQLRYEVVVRNNTYQNGDRLYVVPVEMNFQGVNVTFGGTIDTMESEGRYLFKMNTTRNFTPSTMTVSAQVDRNEIIRETVENNNRLQLEGALELIAGPPNEGPADIVLENLEVIPSNPVRGTLLGTRFSVRNAGRRATGGFAIDLTLGNRNVSGAMIENLNPGESQTVENDAGRIIAGAGTEEQQITARANPYHLVNESDENNNAQSVTLNLRIPEADAGRSVDLIPSRIRRIPVNVMQGGQRSYFALNRDEESDFEVDVLNNDFVQGRSGVLRDIELRLQTGNQTQTRTVTLDSAQATAVFHLRGADLPEGEYDMRVTLDPNQAVAESNEDNNLIEQRLMIRPAGAFHLPQPDLRIGSFTTTPANPQRGDLIISNFNVQNAGDLRTGPFVVMLQNGARDLCMEFVENLNPGQSSQDSFQSCPIRAGLNSDDLALRVWADRFERVSESDENNNQASSHFSFPLNFNRDQNPPSRDLIVTSVQKLPYNYVSAWGDYEINLADEAHFGVFVQDMNFRQVVGEDRTYQTEVQMRSGQWSQTQTVRLDDQGRGRAEFIVRGSDLGVGSYAVESIVDPNRLVVETSDQNNQFERNVNFLVMESGAMVPHGTADLRITGLRTEPARPHVGQPFETIIDVINSGDGASETCRLLLTNPNHILGAQNGIPVNEAYIENVPALEAGESASIRFNRFPMQFLRYGTFDLRAQVDDQEQVMEHEDRNNFWSESIEILPQEGRDLSVERLSALPAIGGGSDLNEINQPARVNMIADIKNNGSENIASYDFILRHIKPNGTQTDYAQPSESTLNSGNSQSRQFGLNLIEPGEHHLQFLVDPNHQIEEFQENNNQAEKIIRVQATQLPPNMIQPVIQGPVYVSDLTLRGRVNLAPAGGRSSFYTVNRSGRVSPLSLGSFRIDAQGQFTAAAGFPAGSSAVFMRQEITANGRTIQLESPEMQIGLPPEFSALSIQAPVLAGQRAVSGICGGAGWEGRVSIHFVVGGQREFDARGNGVCQNGRFQIQLNLDLMRGDQIMAKFSGSHAASGRQMNELESPVMTVEAGVNGASGAEPSRNLQDYDAPQIRGNIFAQTQTVPFTFDEDFNHLSDNLQAFQLVRPDYPGGEIIERGATTNGNSGEFRRIPFIREGERLYVLHEEEFPRTGEILRLQSPEVRVQPRPGYSSPVLDSPIRVGAQSVSGTFDLHAHVRGLRVFTMTAREIKQQGPLNASEELNGNGRFTIRLSRPLVFGERIAVFYNGSAQDGTVINEDRSNVVTVSSGPSIVFNREQLATGTKVEVEVKQKGSLFGALFPKKQAELAPKPPAQKAAKVKVKAKSQKAAQNEQEAAALVSAADIHSMALDTLQKLIENYEHESQSTFMDWVADSFFGADGKRKFDLNKSVEADLNELSNIKFKITTKQPGSLSKNAPLRLNMTVRFNRTADVEVARDRQRWSFSGQSELTFELVGEGDFENLKRDAKGRLILSGIRWKMLLQGLRGDAIFGLTDLDGSLEVKASQFGGQSRLDNERVTTPVQIVGVGGGPATSGRLTNRNASLSSSLSTFAALDIENSNQTDFTIAPTSGADIYLEKGTVINTINAVGSARIAEINSVSASDFNDYTKDREPTSTVINIADNQVILVRTRSGKYAKVLVENLTQSVSTVDADVTYAFQSDGSGNLRSRD